MINGLRSDNSKSFHEEDIKEMVPKVSIWYDTPADDWLKALPLGNGRLAAMIYGTVEKEQIQLNEESLWSGCPIDDDDYEMFKNLTKVRELLLKGKNMKQTG